MNNNNFIEIQKMIEIKKLIFLTKITYGRLQITFKVPFSLLFNHLTLLGASGLGVLDTIAKK
jgi:hypothetical protein